MIDSIAGVADVERLDGARADPSSAPSLLIEVPHGADTRAHYDALRSKMRGVLPADLHVFFHCNTDIGAWAYGRRVAERVIQAHPDRSALLVRCLIPRTFVDTNRLESATDDVAKSGMTAGVAPYVRDPDDIAMLLDLHRRSVRLVEEAYTLVCDAGGFALSPHTYAPRTVGIEKIDDNIVDALRRAHEPEAWASWPERPQIDLITTTPEGARRTPRALVDELVEGYRALDLNAVDGGTYALHPSTQGARWAERWPEQFLCLEVRRDLLVERYAPFDEMRVRADAADRVSIPIAAAIERRFS